MDNLLIALSPNLHSSAVFRQQSLNNFLLLSVSPFTYMDVAHVTSFVDKIFGGPKTLVKWLFVITPCRPVIIDSNGIGYIKPN